MTLAITLFSVAAVLMAVSLVGWTTYAVWRHERDGKREQRERLRSKARRVDNMSEDYTPTPEDCPQCGSRIEQAGELWRCHGLRDRAEVEHYLAPDYRPNGMVPPAITSRDPCGWSAAAADFRRLWV